MQNPTITNKAVATSTYLTLHSDQAGSVFTDRARIKTINAYNKPLKSILSNHLFHYPTPANLSSNWSFASPFQLNGLWFLVLLVLSHLTATFGMLLLAAYVELNIEAYRAKRGLGPLKEKDHYVMGLLSAFFFLGTSFVYLKTGPHGWTVTYEFFLLWCTSTVLAVQLVFARLHWIR